jgi:hypothetical protein
MAANKPRKLPPFPKSAPTVEPEDEPNARASKPKPVRAAADLMVRRALLADPSLRAFARSPSAVVVVELPHADWAEYVRKAWYAEVVARAPNDDPDEQPADVFLLCRSSSAHMSGDEKSFFHALEKGSPVVAFSSSPVRELPAALLQGADRTVVLQPLNGEDLAAAVAAAFGHGVTQATSDDVARLVLPADLRLALRPGQTADTYLARVVDMVQRRQGLTHQAPELTALNGMNAAVQWGLTLDRDLRGYRRGAVAWRDVDRGVLLAGPTGTGKTTYARALARHCGLPLIVGSIASWQASGTGHLGDMLSAMRRCFRDARAAAPCILFIDELDSVGNRETFDPRARDYWVMVMNALLEEIDGAEARAGVVIIAATNRPEAIDPALLRPGRLDRMIEIPLPDSKALVAILQHHLADDLRAGDAELAPLVNLATGATGAHAEQWVRGMRRRAREAKRAPCLADLEAEILGGRKPLSEAARRRIAIHESGHAVVTAIQRPGALRSITVTKVLLDGGVLGYVDAASALADEQARVFLTREHYLGAIAERLAGRAAEQVVFGDLTSGSGGSQTSDLAMATYFATLCVGACGLTTEGRQPPLWSGLPSSNSTPHLLARDPELRRSVHQIVAEGFALAIALVTRHRHAVQAIAARLVDDGHLLGAEVEALVAAGGPSA